MIWPWKRRAKKLAAPEARADDGDRDEGRDDDRDAADGAWDENAAAPLTDELDLHTFRPRECAAVVDEYLRAAQEAGFERVRIIHGKGTGTLRRIVESVLERHPAVRAFQLAGSSGGWGATAVELHPTPATNSAPATTPATDPDSDPTDG